MNPFFSVVIPLYNKEDFVETTLNSVLNQTFNNFELIIINDGSTDNSLKVAQEFKDTRIKIIQQKNLGLSAARNAGIKKAKANYIAFLDADDLWMHDYLQTQYNLIQKHKSESIFATNLREFTSRKHSDLNSFSYNPSNEKLITNYFKICKNIFGPSSLVVKKDLVLDIGYFNESITYGEGDEYFIKCFSKYNLVYYQEAKMLYRVGIQNQLTAPNKNSNRVIPDYEVYLKNNQNKDLKKYIDFVHFKLVVLYKMELNYKLVKFYSEKISPTNLTVIQGLKYYTPTSIFYFLKTFYIWVKSFSH
ncbi:glycosyltransferase family 2 protein [Seonamhaeicola marinus]|uniref:Glycosyltransferase family 2 protein n=1 Tax=Seonamhaeicola marinus TaxID=1912246 RepID=A0A5D0IUF8_9FLAO|nr:glycosyltransferase family A protein [Seonamhaeicola marinus]TYA86791.1 glycosyltransferase family 2 protein [Seonamhaeicola marinus]